MAGDSSKYVFSNCNALFHRVLLIKERLEPRGVPQLSSKGPDLLDDHTSACASVLSFGVFQLFLGLFRFGLVVDFVPIPVIVGFTTGAGVQIIIGQLGTLCGIKGIDTTQAPWQVLGSFLRKLGELPKSKYDLIFGLAALVFILAIKFTCAHLAKKWPLFRFVGIMRNGFAVILFTAISYAVHNSITISIVGTVPKGLSGLPQPNLAPSYLATVLKAVPAAMIVSILEHIAVAKSYGRINGYNPDVNQEIVAIGVSNFVGAFLGAYPATGSFSRSAIKSQSGVRSPMAAFFTAVIILLALYTLTDAFYYIPNSVLAAVISAAVTDLFASPRTIAHLFRSHFVDFICFWIALVVTFFSTIEIAIYSSVAFSLVVLLVRIARPKARLLSRTETAGWIDAEGEGYSQINKTLLPTPPGIIVFRPYEALTYPNSSYIASTLKAQILKSFRYTGVARSKGERSWDDDTEERAARAAAAANTASASSLGSYDRERLRAPAQLPPLRAVVFDFSAVNAVDYTGLQMLLDLRDDLHRFAGRRVPFHFAHVRRDQLKTLWDVPESAAAARDPVVAGTVQQQEDAVSLEDGWNGRFFHLSVDEGVNAADLETAEVLTAETQFLTS
ncbi:sulfate transporter family-domain-containing protein [Zopfochytrium polystomum]|nr:sulfate transporter family-domain-containing protein [Zopfochytrium polystomum]